MLAGLALCLAAAARAADTAAIPGNVSSWAVQSNRAGTAPDSRKVDIAVHMTLRDLNGLRDFVSAVSKPGRPLYGHYLTKEQFRSAFAPASEDVLAVKNLLEKAGMTNISVGPSNAYVFATATVAQLRSTFSVTQDLYSFHGHTLRANREAPTLPAALASKVLFIEGLDDSTYLKKPMHRSVDQHVLRPPAGYVAHTADATTITPPPVVNQDPSPYCSTYFGDHKATLSTKPAPYAATLPWLMCGYSPEQIREAYGLNKVRYDGAGLTVAIIDAYASPTLQADGNHYAAKHQLPPLTSANFAEIIPQGIYGANPDAPCGPYGWWTEQSLDLASVHGSAPGANILFVGSTDCGTSLTVAFLNVIYNQEADILTNSYSDNGEALPAGSIAMVDQAAMTAAAQGQTLLFSSGDDGDLSQVNGVASGAYPSTSPYVTAVGGTSLALYHPSGAKDEWGWGTARDFLVSPTVNSATSITTAGLTTVTNDGLTYADFSFYSGSGGGISLVEPQPSYQVGVVPTSLAESLNEASGYTVTLPAPMRVVPDVAMDADPYTGYLYGQTYTIAGDYSDANCTPLTTTTEYCEIAEGGTSLASPLMAGTIAVVDQARKAAGRPVVGFANPWLYATKPGTTLQASGLNDVQAPTKPTAVLRAYVANSNVRVVTINSVPDVLYLTPFALQVCATAICEGIDDVFNYTTAGYDDVTGLGVPYVPNLIKQ
jgi:subtilase family serine protease